MSNQNYIRFYKDGDVEISENEFNHLWRKYFRRNANAPLPSQKELTGLKVVEGKSVSYYGNYKKPVDPKQEKDLVFLKRLIVIIIFLTGLLYLGFILWVSV